MPDTLEHAALAETAATLRGESDERFFREFDAALGGYDSRLVGLQSRRRAVLADAVRSVLGQPTDELTDAEALATVLDPARNAYLGHPLFLAMNSKLMQTLNHVPFTFQKRISGAEDAQNQRHRGTLSSAPGAVSASAPRSGRHRPARRAAQPRRARGISRHHSGALGRQEPTARRRRARRAGALSAAEQPPLRFYETGTLLTYYWKWIKRLCYNAQREIFETALARRPRRSRGAADDRPLRQRPALRACAPRRPKPDLSRRRALLRRPRLAQLRSRND